MDATRSRLTDGDLIRGFSSARRALRAVHADHRSAASPGSGARPKVQRASDGDPDQIGHEHQPAPRSSREEGDQSSPPPPATAATMTTIAARIRCSPKNTGVQSVFSAICTRPEGQRLTRCRAARATRVGGGGHQQVKRGPGDRKHPVRRGPAGLFQRHHTKGPARTSPRWPQPPRRRPDRSKKQGPESMRGHS